MRWIIGLTFATGWATFVPTTVAQVPPPAVADSEDELRAVPDEPPTTPAVLPAVYSRTVPAPRSKKPHANPPASSNDVVIPAGKFGLQLADGTRLIGIPQSKWTLVLKTGFGTSTIPLPQVKSVVSKDRSTVVVNLTNGDRLTGQLLVTAIPYVTRFGTLTVPSSALIELRRGGQPAVRKPGKVVRNRPTIAPPRAVGPGVSPAGYTVPTYPTPLPPPAPPAAGTPFRSGAPIPDASVIRDLVIRR